MRHLYDAANRAKPFYSSADQMPHSAVNPPPPIANEEDFPEHDEEYQSMSTKSEFLESCGIYYLCSDITFRSVSDCIEWILVHNLQPEPLEELTLIITSLGGLVDASFSLTDMMEGSSIPIKTVGLGTISSCGLLIFMAGAKGHRILTENTSILSHTHAGGNFGKSHELVASIRHNDLTSEKIMKHYKKHTGLSEKQIKSKLLTPSDVWLTAKEAKELKICDEIRLNK